MHMLVFPLARLLAEIKHLYFWQVQSGSAFAQTMKRGGWPIRARGIVPAFQRSRRAAEHDRALGKLRSADRHIAPLVTRRLILLVGTVMLFIDADQAKPVIGNRGKDRRAS